MKNAPPPASATDKTRLDKWLWAARLYKTRSLSAQEVDKGRVRVNGQSTKPSRDIKPGDVLELRSGPLLRTVVVRALSGVRGPAPLAARLYEETAASVALRTALAEQQRLAPDPAHSLHQGRPTKRDRRDLGSLHQRADRGAPVDDNERWSATLDDDESLPSVT